VKTLIAFAALVAASVAHALEVAPPPYQARRDVAGLVRVWGNAQLTPLLERWEAGFRALHPRVRFENALTGSDVAMAGLYTGKADVALLGRTAGASEVKAFEWIYRYKPERVEIANGGFEGGHSPALVAYVHHDNPLARLTLQQLDALFSPERSRGAANAIRTWGDLGLGGIWAKEPVRLYTFDTESGTGRFFREAVLKDSRKLYWERLTEFRDSEPLRTDRHDAGTSMLQALARDRYGLAVASGPAVAGVRALALAPVQNAQATTATRANLVSRRYPLGRPVFAYFNRKPDTPLDAPVAAFLRYVVSAEGQRAVDERSGYLPLDAAAAGAQAKGLRDSP
jgi:phosphate transport system substrate-binding protein